MTAGDGGQRGRSAPSGSATKVCTAVGVRFLPMTTPRWNLAQFNIARMRYPLDDDRMAGFVDQLDAVNAIAEESPGFVWRHQTDEGNSTSIRMFDDSDVIVNFSVWETIESLHDFTYRHAEHRTLLRRRREWFEPVADMPVMVMWWVPAGDLPTLDDARERLEHLRDNGPSARGFTFRHRHRPPDADRPPRTPLQGGPDS